MSCRWALKIFQFDVFAEIMHLFKNAFIQHRGIGAYLRVYYRKALSFQPGWPSD